MWLESGMRIRNPKAGSIAKRMGTLFERNVRWFLMIVIGAVASVVLCFILFILAVHIRAAVFDEEMSKAKFLGKTPQQIIAQFGTPIYDSRTDGGGTKDRVYIAYRDRWSGEICRIEITKGAATDVDYFRR
jgi:hypothetical protein